MKKSVLVIGNGAREHALGWKVLQSERVKTIYFAPGNAGTSAIGENLDILSDDIQKLLSWAKKNTPSLTVVGPELPLVEGIVDAFIKAGLTVFGPTKAAARLEGSKGWAAQFMERHDIPQPASRVFTDIVTARLFIETVDFSGSGVVVKADGLAAGKGVLVPDTKEEALQALTRIMVDREFGEAGNSVVIQDRLEGPEVSILALSDGQTVVPLPPARDYKRIGDGDAGPNTGGMGAISPVPDVDGVLTEKITETILKPAIAGMAEEGIPYSGVLYAGIMLTREGPKVLEFNVRFGDPETQVVLPRLTSDLYTIMEAVSKRRLSPDMVTISPEAAVCVVLASGGYPGKAEKGRTIDGLRTAPQAISVFHAGTSVREGNVVTSGGRVLSVVGMGKSVGEAREKIYSAIGDTGIHFEGMQFRSDIGIAPAIFQKEEPIEKLITEVPPGVVRIEIYSTIPDMRATVRKNKFASQTKKLSDVFLADVYTIEAALTNEEIRSACEVLVNPVTQRAVVRGTDATNLPRFDWAVEIGFLPGVTDNIAQTAREMIADRLGRKFTENERVYCSQISFVQGDISKGDVQFIAGSLFNPLIQRAHIKGRSQYMADGGMDVVVPKVNLAKQPSVSFVDLHIPDEELGILGKSGIPNADGSRRGPLALDMAYLTAIRTYFDAEGRNPTDVELESIAQTWSEHCKHTIFADPIDDVTDGLFNTYIKRATEEIRKKKGEEDFCVSVFTDNSGAIVFDEEYLITDKVETHNSPSALDPFGGAITGIVGVNRDALGFGLGAKPVLNRYGFCFGDPRDESVLFRDKEGTQQLLSARRIMDGVVDGVNSGGNCSGIPTPQGFVYFDGRFRGKPLIFVGTVGLIPRQRGDMQLASKKAQPGDYVVMAGGRVGLDGIHGATFSSEALSTGSPATAVQIGDPITQKKLSDVLTREARDRGFYSSITDNGAGGLSCSVAEMAKESGGCRVDLERVPLKYPGLEPWQIWISESQERMTLAVPKESWEEFSTLLARRGVETTIIGEFTDSGRCVVEYQGMQVMDVAMDFLHDGLPPRPMHTTTLAVSSKDISVPDVTAENGTDAFVSMTGRLNTGSFEVISAQYDHEVQGGSVLKPLQGAGLVNGDATAVRPRLSSPKSVVVSQALFPGYSELDPYRMAVSAIDAAVRNVVAAGADPARVAILDNFCWCSSTDPVRLAQLKEAARGCYDAALALETPFISGKDSMFNDFKGYGPDLEPVKISVPPTLLISSLAVVDNGDSLVSLDFKAQDDRVYILGETTEHLGGSEYARVHGIEGGIVPAIDPRKAKELYKAYHRCVRDGLIASAQSVNHGGIAAALAKSSIGGMRGATISLGSVPGSWTKNAEVLFSETPGRILVSVAPANAGAFEDAMRGFPVAAAGVVRGDKRIVVHGVNEQVLVDTSVSELYTSYKNMFGITHHVQPSVAVLSGYGFNCEEETAHAFGLAGASTQIVHVNDLVDGSVSLSQFEILAFPGGFSFGDDTGSGNAYAWKLKSHLWESILSFIHDDHLVIGLCNGFQVLVNLGLLPALEGKYGEREVALVHNTNARYTARWVDLAVRSTSPWYKNVHALSLPIAHGEGKLVANADVLAKLKQKGLIAATYTRGEVCQMLRLPANPNGSLENIAALTDETGRILGMMPHPERAIVTSQLPHWTSIRERAKREGRKLPEYGPGLAVFKNGVEYFSQ